MKRLPTNSRATAIAESCGFNPPPTFHGDVFISRVATRPMMTNVDFVVGTDTDRGAEWMKRAIAENLAWQQEMNKIQGKSETQPWLLVQKERLSKRQASPSPKTMMKWK